MKKFSMKTALHDHFKKNKPRKIFQSQNTEKNTISLKQIVSFLNDTYIAWENYKHLQSQSFNMPKTSHNDKQNNWSLNTKYGHSSKLNWDHYRHTKCLIATNTNSGFWQGGSLRIIIEGSFINDVTQTWSVSYPLPLLSRSYALSLVYLCHKKTPLPLIWVNPFKNDP